MRCDSTSRTLENNSLVLANHHSRGAPLCPLYVAIKVFKEPEESRSVVSRRVASPLPGLRTNERIPSTLQAFPLPALSSLSSAVILWAVLSLTFVYPTLLPTTQPPLVFSGLLFPPLAQ
ncbi:hypothetical protein BJX61DRAFT_30282 [Aspergillus egyptiacus]|nr:hypothetical protein BJX61DRAFT_30282 [Aspergillus egyptiacus]